MDPTAVMGKRIGAWLIDFVIAIVIFAVAFFLFGDSVETGLDLCGVQGSPTLCLYAGDTMYFADGADANAIFFLTYGSGLAFGWLLQGATGGTPGKLMVGLRVIDRKTGQLAGFGKCLGRTLMWVIDGLPGIPLVGLITGAASKGHRRVGDMAAGTLVVAMHSVGVPPVVPGLTEPGGVMPPPAGARPVGGSTPPPPGGYAPAPAPSAAPSAAPTPSVYEPPAATTAAASDAGDGISAPKWDADRNAYIQWDAGQGVWLQFDDASQQWFSIS